MDTGLLIFLIVLVIVTMIVFVMFLRMQSSIQSQRMMQQLQELLNKQQYEGFEKSKLQEQEYRNTLMMFQDKINLQMGEFQDRMQQQLVTMSRNVSSDLSNNLQNSTQLFQKVLEQVSKVDASSRSLQELSGSIKNLQLLLNDKKTRGIFGEIELYSLLENVYGEEGQRYRKQMKLSTGVIADCVLINENAPNICVDSKFPLENYNRLVDAKTKAEELQYQKLFAADVKKQIVSVASKYIIANETADFVYLFLPAEALFSYIHAHLQEIVEFAYEKHVYLVSPSTFMAYLTAMKAVYLNQKRNESMEELQKAFNGLAVEFGRFEQRYQSLAKDYEKTYQDFHTLSITVNKLLDQFARIQNVDLS